MDTTLIYIYQAILGIIAVCILLFFGYKWYLSKHTKVTCRAAARVFRSHGALRHWKVLTDVSIGEGAAAVVVDQVVVGPFGVILACDLHQKGNVYGDLTAKEWILTNGKEGEETKERIDSPYYRATQAMELLSQRLAKEKIYKVPLEIMVPKTGKKQRHYITGGNDYLFDCGALKAQIAKSRYDKDNGVKVEQITALFGA